MTRSFIKALTGICAGYALGRLLPVWILLSVCLALFASAVFLFWLPRLGIRDFQEY